MPAAKLKQFLDSRGVRYVSVGHSPAYTAPEVAESAHIAGRDFAKTVIVKIDGEMAMVVLPANRKIVLSDLRDMLASQTVDLATEAEFERRFLIASAAQCRPSAISTDCRFTSPKALKTKKKFPSTPELTAK